MSKFIAGGPYHPVNDSTGCLLNSGISLHDAAALEALQGYTISKPDAAPNHKAAWAFDDADAFIAEWEQRRKQ